MTEMFGEAWSPMSVPDLAPDDDDDELVMPAKYNVCIHNYPGDSFDIMLKL